MHRTRRATEGFCALFDLQTQKVQPVGIHLLPLLTAGLVRLEHVQEFQRNPRQLTLVKHLNKVVVEVHVICFVINFNRRPAVRL